MVRALVALVPADDPAVLDDLARLEGIREERATRAGEYFQANAARWEELRALYVDDDLVDARLLSAMQDERVGRLLDTVPDTGQIGGVWSMVGVVRSL